MAHYNIVLLTYLHLQGEAVATQDCITEMTSEDWDSLKSLLTDDVDVKTEFHTSPLSVPDLKLDSNRLSGVVIQTGSSNVGVSVKPTCPLVNVNMNAVLKSKVDIRPKPSSFVTTHVMPQTGSYFLYSLDGCSISQPQSVLRPSSFVTTHVMPQTGSHFLYSLDGCSIGQPQSVLRPASNARPKYTKLN